VSRGQPPQWDFGPEHPDVGRIVAQAVQAGLPERVSDPAAIAKLVSITRSACRYLKEAG
jgi:hypothetical protein